MHAIRKAGSRRQAIINAPVLILDLFLDPALVLDLVTFLNLALDLDLPIPRPPWPPTYWSGGHEN